jgi:uracil-DNA glycosylase family 4
MEVMSNDLRPAAIDLLIRHLEQQRASGVTHIWLAPEARLVMRELARPRPRDAATKSGPAWREATPAAAAPATRPLAATQPPARRAAPGVASGRAEQLEAVRAGVLSCSNYRALIKNRSLREIMVFAVGNPDSPLMFIGEAPGAEEERQGEPFVGPAGQLLTKIVKAMGLERSEVYISNIVKYRPAIAGGTQGERNRKPEAAEMAAGRPHLLREIEIIQPRVIVTLGGTATEGLFEEPVAITRARGCFREFQGIPVMPTFHPSYLLRSASLTDRRKLWEDMLQVMERLAMPISDKQRRFFSAGEKA